MCNYNPLKMKNFTNFNYFLSVLAIIFWIHGSAFSQVTSYSRDTISMEPGRTHDLYYSLKTGEKYQHIRSDWDILFSTAQMDVTIRTNGAQGVNLYVYPWADTSSWNAVDTSGLFMFPMLHNSDKSWEMGAFNVSTTGSELDYGWGVYNILTHKITGDSIFIIKLPGGTAKKIWIQEKNPMQNVYKFKFANIDGSDETAVTLNLNEYNSKAFVGYSLTSKQVVDREPVTESWDLLFTKYMTFYNNQMWYPVTGILTNYDIEVASHSLCDTATVAYNPNSLDSANISVIGNYWFKLAGGMPPTYEIFDSLVYFISDHESSIWKVVFEYYNSGEGKIGFRKALVEDHASVTEINGYKNGKLAISPNPVQTTTQVLFNADNSGMATLSVTGIDGKTVYQQPVFYQHGLNSVNLDLNQISSGLYIVTLQSGNYRLQNKLVKN